MYTARKTFRPKNPRVQHPAKLQTMALFPAEQGSLGMFFELTTEEPDVILAGFRACAVWLAKQDS
jgi:hypothetical protein